MSRLLPTEKDRSWYLRELEAHVGEIRELLERDGEIYRGDETCAEHARVEAYDLVVLAAELFEMDGVLESVPDEIIQRFNRKRR
jgi:hypothetical protein